MPQFGMLSNLMNHLRQFRSLRFAPACRKMRHLPGVTRNYAIGDRDISNCDLEHRAAQGAHSVVLLKRKALPRFVSKAFKIFRDFSTGDHQCPSPVKALCKEGLFLCLASVPVVDRFLLLPT